MSNRFQTASIHIIAWLLLLLVPYLSSAQVIRSFLPDYKGLPLAPLFILSILTISIFYLNYYLLIPRFLLKNRLLRYIFMLLAVVLGAFILSSLYFYFLGMHPKKLAALSPTLARISPIIRANAFLMLAIAIIASISLALNNRLKQIEREKLSAQISSLKAQINPHFLFNTLNSIYATAIDTSPATADMVEKLSVLMRYSLTDTQQDLVPLEDEIAYIENYIELQRVRLDKNVGIKFTCTGDPSDHMIAPMLLISFIENAFKHGVNAEQKSKIKINISIVENEVHLQVLNRKVSIQTYLDQPGGLGIENTRKRLRLIYPSRHLLNIRETEKDFNVSLHIQLQ